MSTKAWMVSDKSGDHGATIVWDDDGRRARRLGASEIDLSWEEVSCVRYPALDNFTGTAVELTHWQLENGWHFPCNGLKPDGGICHTVIYEKTDDVAVDDGGCVYCSTSCKVMMDAKREERRVDEEKIRTAAQARFPGAKIGLVYRSSHKEAIAYVDHVDGRNVCEVLEGV